MVFIGDGMFYMPNGMKIIYDLLSFDFIYVLGFECYLYENLELILIFCTLMAAIGKRRTMIIFVK
jgi:hypothetical protein